MRFSLPSSHSRGVYFGGGVGVSSSVSNAPSGWRQAGREGSIDGDPKRFHAETPAMEGRRGEAAIGCPLCSLS